MRAPTESLDKFYESVMDWDSSNHDDFSQITGMSYTPTDHLMYTSEGFGGLFGQNVASEAGMTDHAFRQLCEMTDVPARWAADPKSCPPELRSLIFGYKLPRHTDSRLLVRQRTVGDSPTMVRALLSDQYARYDHKNLVTAIKQIVDANNLDVVVVRPEVSDNLRAYILFPNINFDPRGGNGSPTADGGGAGGLHPGIYIRNSEVGGQAVGVHGGLFRSYCQNGMIIGWNAEDTFSIAHRWKSEALMRRTVNDAMAVAMKLTEAAAEAFLQMQDETIPTENLSNIVGSWSKKFSLPEATRISWDEAVAAISRKQETVSRFDLINEATYLAASLESTDTRETLERMAGEMVTERLRTRTRYQ